MHCSPVLCKSEAPGIHQAEYGINPYYFSLNSTDVAPSTSILMDLSCCNSSLACSIVTLKSVK
jgi:hypothetical protein